jgi:hypothetical protein
VHLTWLDVTQTLSAGLGGIIGIKLIEQVRTLAARRERVADARDRSDRLR